MFVLSPDNKPQDIFLFTSESYAVEALIEGGKEFFLSYSKLVNLKFSDKKSFIYQYSYNPDLEIVRVNNDIVYYNSLLKKFQTELETIQTIEKFNELSISLRKSKLIQDFHYKIHPIKLISVFFGDYHNSILSRKWILKECNENQLLTNYFSEQESKLMNRYNSLSFPSEFP